MIAALPIVLMTIVATPAYGADHDGPAPAGFRLIELTGDGRPDKLVLGADGRLNVEVNVGDGRFLTVEQELPTVVVSSLITGDLNEDGIIDLYVVSPGDNVALVGTGAGYLRVATQRLGLVDAGHGQSADWVDVDADGYPDLVLHNVTGDVIFWRRAAGRFVRDGEGPVDPTEGDAGASWSQGGASVPGQQPLGAGGGPTPSLGAGGPPAPGSQLGRLEARLRGAPRGPSPGLLPASLAELKALFVEDDKGEVDGADVIDGSLDGADVSTSTGDVTFVGGDVGVGTASPQSPLHVAGNARVDGILSMGTTPVLDASGEWIGSSSALGRAAFKAHYPSGGTFLTLANNTFTKMVFPIEDFDSSGAYDPATGTFTATEAGVYSFTLHATLALPVAPGSRFQVSLYKNGVNAAETWTQNALSNQHLHTELTTLFELGVGDTIEFYVNQANGAMTTEDVFHAPNLTWASGHRVF